MEAGSASALEMDARLLRGRVRVGRGERSEALEDSMRALDLGRRAAYPEMIVPALALHGRVLESVRHRDNAMGCAEELLSLWPDSCASSYWVADVAFTLHSLGLSQRLFEAVERARTTTQWLDAATAVAQGNFRSAAESFEAIGSAPDAAIARLRAGQALAETGAHRQAEAELGRALSAFQQFGATSYLREAERLLLPLQSRA
jgi:tetratricopeptide (TPR) repeat protein